MRSLSTLVRTVTALSLALLSASCATTGNPAGAYSGTGITGHPGQSENSKVDAAPKAPVSRPKVVIPNTTKKAVVDALASQMLAHDYSIDKVEDYRAQFEKPGGFWLNVLAGSDFNRNALWRITYSLLDTPSGVLVIADIGTVTNPGSGFEKVREVKGGKDAVAVQRILDEVRDEIGRAAAPAPVADSTASAK